MRGIFSKFEAFGPNQKSEPEGWPPLSQKIENDLEVDRDLYSDLSKRLTSNILLSNGCEKEKRHKKFPEFKFQQGLESINKPSLDDSQKFYISKLFDVYGQLSNLRVEFEEKVEMEIANEFKNFSELECPKVLKTRKNLGKSVQNLKSAKEKVKSCESDLKKSAQQNLHQQQNMLTGNSSASMFSSAQLLANTASSISNLSLNTTTSHHHNNSSSSSTVNNPSLSTSLNISSSHTTTSCMPGLGSSQTTTTLNEFAAKLPSHVFLDIDPSVKASIETASPDVVAKYKSALNAQEDAEKEVATLKDQCLLELYSYKANQINREAVFLQYIETLSDYMEKCTQRVQECIPQFRDRLESLRGSTIYGVELSESLLENNTYTYVIERVYNIFHDYNFFKEDGIFRVAGQRSKVKLFSAALNIYEDDNPDLINNCGPYAVADSLKQYLRQLPNPLLTTQLNAEWTLALESGSMQSYMNVLEKMPKDYYNNLRLLVELLVQVSEHSDANKMTASNLGIVFGPNLFRSSSESKEKTSYANNSNQGAPIVQFLIENAEQLFGISPKSSLEDYSSAL